MRRRLLSLCAVLVPTLLHAQMSGSYTVDPKGSGSRNFPSFAYAANALTSNGVSGPVVFRVASADYKSSATFYPVAGASASNTITFRSVTPLGARRDVSSGKLMLQSLGGMLCRWLRFDGIDFFRSVHISPNSALIGTAGDLDVRNCRFGPGCFVYFTKSPRVELHHNEFFQAVLRMGGGDCDVHHNVFRDARSPSVAPFRIEPDLLPNRVRCYNNVIWGRESLVTVNPGTDFIHNTVVVLATSNPYFLMWAMRVYSGSSFGPRIENNVIVNLNGGSLIAFDRRSEYKPPFCAIDANVYWSNTKVDLFTYGTSSASKTLAHWQKASGQDKNSFFAAPNLEDTKATEPRLRPLAPSPAIGKARNTPRYVTDDFAGVVRGQPSTIGAYEGIPAFNVFGKGCAGTGGQVPVLGYMGDLKLGSTNFGITLSNARGGAGVQAFFAVGASRLIVPFGAGCDLLVSPDIVLGLPVTNGTAVVKFAVPSHAKWRGAQAHFQWGVVDAAAAGSIDLAFSNAATLSL